MPTVTDILSALFSSLSTSLPYLATLIIGMFLWIFSSTGTFPGGGNIGKHTRKIFGVTGSILFFLGFCTLTIILPALFLDATKAYHSYWMGLWNQSLLFLSSPVLFIIILVGLITGSIIVIARRRAIEKGYKIQLTPIIDENRVGIKVENIGASVQCCAKLVRVDWRSPSGSKKTETIDINSLNPRGLYLGWGRAEVSGPNISAGGTTFVNLLQIYSASVKFLFANEETYNIVFPSGYYTIVVEILREKKGKWICFSEFEETFKITRFDDMEWLKKKPIRKVSKMPKQRSFPKKQ